MHVRSYALMILVSSFMTLFSFLFLYYLFFVSSFMTSQYDPACLHILLLLQPWFLFNMQNMVTRSLYFFIMHTALGFFIILLTLSFFYYAVLFLLPLFRYYTLLPPCISLLYSFCSFIMMSQRAAAGPHILLMPACK